MLAPDPPRALVLCLLLGVATWMGSRTAARALSGALAVAGGLLLAMVAFDLGPDALADGAQQGTPAVLLLAMAGAVGSALWWLLRPSSGALGSRWRLRATAGGLVAHRILEGATVAVTAAVDLRAEALVLVALVVHGGCEGAVLTATAGDLGCAQRTTASWLVLMCAAPVVGVFGAALTETPGLRAPATAAVCGLLLATGSANLRRARAQLPRYRSVALGTAGAGLLLLTLYLGP